MRVMKADPPAACSEMGPVKGGSGLASIAPQNIEYGKNAMRNSAADLGANYVRWDLVDHTGLVSGTAFHCPEGSVQ